MARRPGVINQLAEKPERRGTILSLKAYGISRPSAACH
jgi:hypothetical protein